MALSKGDILGADDLPKEEVRVDEWGGTVFVRTMTAGERDEFEQQVISLRGKPNQNVRARLAVLCCCDSSGTRLFSDDDVDALGRKNASALDKIWVVATRLAGLSKNDAADLEKN